MRSYLADHIFRTRIFNFGSFEALGVTNDTTPKSHYFLLEFIAKPFKIFSLGDSFIKEYMYMAKTR